MKNHQPTSSNQARHQKGTTGGFSKRSRRRRPQKNASAIVATLPLITLSRVYAGISCLAALSMVYLILQSPSFQYILLAVMAVLFAVSQSIIANRAQSENDVNKANALIITGLLLCILTIAVMVANAVLICTLFLVMIPLHIAVTGQLKALPSGLFVTFVAAAAVILVNHIMPAAAWRLTAPGRDIWLMVGVGFSVYLAFLGGLTYLHYIKKGNARRLKVNVATQYALIFTGISAMVIILVTGVMIHQIRIAQLNQVGKSYQTVAENFAKLVGSHLEQQTQKLQMLTEQAPILREGLLQANSHYTDKTDARNQLVRKNRRWKGPGQDNTFVIGYMNNPITHTLSRFRGHNSFHYDLILVDRYGGLVASLGQKPENIYFYDQTWWSITWNQGLGNIFVGDLVMDERTRIPKLRIAVDIIDHTTNDVIGMLSSTYLLRTLLEDIERFKPDTLDAISLIDSRGRLIACTFEDLPYHHHTWSNLEHVTTLKSSTDSGWILGRDHHDQRALIGFSTLSTAYNVISDPLHRLGWHIVVSGTRSNALSDVRRSTELAMFVGLVAMALGVLGAIAAARVITRPIEDLTATASAMSAGNLDQRASITGPEELVALSTGFNQLTDRLHNVIRNLRSQTRQLAVAKRSAEEATRLKGEFLANMSHEIRTPLNAILGFAHILESSLADEKQKRHAQTISASGSDLLHLINDILDLSKIEAGRMEIQLGPVNLRDICTELQRIFSISAEEKNIAFEITVSPELPGSLLLDRVRLRQVLFNLIGNAVKFTEQGSIKCVAKGSPDKEKKTWDLTIDVSDTGIGIEPEAHGTIFESFKQHQNRSDKPPDGTGLGLSISKSLIEMMHGRIDVEGQPGKGSVFTVHIPGVVSMADEACATGLMVTEEITRSVQFKPASILVADDLEVNRHLIVESLKPYPLAIDQAEHGQAAVSLAIENRFDLILMDIRMPQMDGYSALREIRRHFNGGGPCVIATTASAMKEDIAKIKYAGFSDHLIRPFGRDALVNLLMQYLPHELTGDGLSYCEWIPPLTVPAIKAQPPWVCPPQVRDYLLNTLREQWEQAREKQSIPDIIAFANDVRSAGKKHHIELLERYGRELAEYAEGFDIQNVEKLLHLYDDILNCRSDHGGGEEEEYEKK